jgi:hypothetical protein
MLKHLASALALIAAGSAFAVETADIPTSPPISRYAQMLDKSPFALATPLAPPEPTTQPWAASLYVAGVAKIGDKDLVTIRSRNDQQTIYSLMTGEEKDGVSIVSVQWADQVGKSKVKVKKGAEAAMLEFDQATVQKSVPVPAFTPNMGRGAIALPQPQMAAPATLPQPPQPVVAPNPQPNAPFGWQPGSPAPKTAQPPHSLGAETGTGYGGRRRVIPSRPTQ